MSKLLSIVKIQKFTWAKKITNNLYIIKQFCKINEITSEIIACKTVRSRRGYALSSRNILLNEKYKKL
jgi:Panthothenate synthetase